MFSWVAKIDSRAIVWQKRIGMARSYRFFSSHKDKRVADFSLLALNSACVALEGAKPEVGKSEKDIEGGLAMQAAWQCRRLGDAGALSTP